VPVYANDCDPNRPCPIYSGGGGSAPGTVTPSIVMTGVGNITNTTQSVVIGQQIALSASYTLPSGVTVTSQSWSVPGTTVGGFPGDGTVMPTNFGNVQSTTFYWVTVGSSGQASYQVTYTLNTSAGNYTASTTFNVAGPTSLAATATPGTIMILNNDSMSFGVETGTPGMSFSASAVGPSGHPGTFWWVQVVASSSWTDTPIPPYEGQTCSFAPGALDTQFPYDTGAHAADTPSTGLLSEMSQISSSDSFSTYLMWNPNVGTGSNASIPVPLGAVAWGWSGDAVQDESTGVWALGPSSIAPHSFTPSTTFPTWSGTDNGDTGEGATCDN
jgi:hypothetical protein